MTTATAAAPQLKLQERVDQITSDLRVLNAKLNDEKSKLESLVASRPELARKLAVGQAKPDQSRELAVSIADCELVIEGLTSLASEMRASLDSAEMDLRKLHAEEDQRKRRARLEELRREGQRYVDQLHGHVAQVVEDVDRLGRGLQTLTREFVNIDGRVSISAENADELAIEARRLVHAHMEAISAETKTLVQALPLR